MTLPQPLDRLPANPELSDVATSVTVNYGRYHELAAQLQSLQEWAAGLGK